MCNRRENRLIEAKIFLNGRAVRNMVGCLQRATAQYPDPVLLDGNALNEYAGRYEAGPTMKITFAHQGAYIDIGSVEKSLARQQRTTRA